jgi:hypothetical protein
MDIVDGLSYMHDHHVVHGNLRGVCHLPLLYWTVLLNFRLLRRVYTSGTFGHASQILRSPLLREWNHGLARPNPFRHLPLVEVFSG